jgi:hypothetical protein
MHSLNFLTAQKRADLIAFLESLTGEMPANFGHRDCGHEPGKEITALWQRYDAGLSDRRGDGGQSVRAGPLVRRQSPRPAESRTAPAEDKEPAPRSVMS